MAKPVAKHILDILTKHDVDPKEALWDCHGTWVMYHRHCEIIGAKAGVTFSPPQIIEADTEKKTVAICVVGSMDTRSEWAFGEAAPANNKNSYPYAMAEKRAKDRVILKLVGLSGFVYSDEETDDFKAAAPEPKPEPPKEAAKPLPKIIPKPKEGWIPLTAKAFTKDFLDTARALDKPGRQKLYEINEATIKDLRQVNGTTADYLDSKFAELP